MELYKVIVPTLIFFSKSLWPTLMIQNPRSVQIIVGKMEIKKSLQSPFFF